MIVPEVIHRSEGKSTKGLPQSVIDLDGALTYVEQQDWNLPVMVIHGAQDEIISYDGVATIGHKDEITNPNVIYKTCDKPGRDGHNTLFQSEAAAKYIVGMNEEYDKIYDQYDGEVPDEVKAEYYSGVDKALTNELDAEFMSEVNDFYEANR